jgi:raffinose/stachyose/melibiose transport system permease protein
MTILDRGVTRGYTGLTRAERVRARTATGLKYTSLVAASVVTLLPLIAFAMISLKGDPEYLLTSPLRPPEHLTFDNYVTAFTQGRMLKGFINTSIILAVSVTGTVLIGSMAAYALDRFEFRGKRLIIGAFLLATLVPGVTTQVATFKIVVAMELYNRLWAPIALFLGTDIIAIYIFIQFLRSIPRELDESAALDGANKLTVYWRIILPLMKPAIATVVIIKGVAIYNEFYIPFLYMPSRELPVISTAVYRFKGPFGTQWELIAAGVIIVIIPTLIAFLALQRFFYNGLTSGSIK